MKTRVMVAEDQRMMRELVVELLSREDDLAVVAEARSGLEAVVLACAERPDVLLLDIGLPGLSGLAVARTLRERLPRLRIVALTVHETPEKVREMLAAGALGYVTKASACRELISAVRAVLQGRTYLSAGMTRPADEPAKATRLGSRERQVVTLIAEGKRSPEIAARLGISVGTVEVHRRNIMRKLGMHSVAELTRFALREGLTSL
jgi:two-component system NarL family response regulator